MKKILFSGIVAVGLLTLSLSSIGEADTDGTGKKLPSVNIKDMAGNNINTANFSNDGNPIVISFWATWCKPCKLELNTIADLYDDWQDETGVKLVAVSVDNERTKNSVKPQVNAAGWEYDVWLDPNGDFKRAMGVNNVPHTFLLDGEGNIVYSHTGYSLGDEEELFEKIVALTH